ncbi:MAG: hypothetical protein ACJA2W_002838 [Planctomycetota bacterium]|jgi:hypothetical protein
MAAGTATVLATELPPDAPGYFIASTTTGFVPNAGGGQGDLCQPDVDDELLGISRRHLELTPSWPTHVGMIQPREEVRP